MSRWFPPMNPVEKPFSMNCRAPTSESRSVSFRPILPSGLLGVLKLAVNLIALSATGAEGAVASEALARPAARAEAIPWSEIGARAGADYKGDALAVSPT